MRWVDGHATAVTAKLPLGVILAFDDITDFGRSGWLLVPLGAMLVAVAAAFMSPALNRVSRMVVTAVAVRLGFLFVAIGLPGLVGTILKRCIGRVRPSSEGPFAYEPFSWHSAYASMPSGHTITAFAALVAIGLISPRLRPVLWVYALTIAASRIIVSAHYPSDVIAGAAFGSLGALLVRDWFAARRLAFQVGADGRVQARPGPSWTRLHRVAGALFHR
jgi:undecaprenyl-diphosphatase